MHNLCMKVLNKEMEILAVGRGINEVNLVYDGEYQEGDIIVLEASEGEHLVWLQFDDALGKSIVFLTGNVTYRIPFGDRRINLSPKAFAGKKHLLTARMVKDYEAENYRNLAINVCDQHDIQNLYPHAVANVETRGESVFAAQNAIDGVTANTSHGEWPYESWGINMQDDAKIRIDFGRKVVIDRIILYTRADFPHDNWWEQVSFAFSDGSDLDVKLNKSDKPHEFIFEKKTISWLEMHDMKKSNDPSPFPALSQIEVYGKDIIEKSDFGSINCKD